MSATRTLSQALCTLLALLLLTGCTSASLSPTATPTMPLATATSAPTLTPTPTAKETLWLAHYMPWYQTPEIGGFWGWHWTMNHFDPNELDENGRRQIASHYYPLTGPYDSRDVALLEYQAALMKLSGIDGVIVDWYGNEDYLDYGLLNDSTLKLFEVMKQAGLKFAVCYEDQTIKRMVAEKHLDDGDVYTYAQGVMDYLQSTWFQQDTYLKIDGRPVLFIFGPQYFVNVADWYTIFEKLNPQPIFITLDFQVAAAATGGYPWPPMSETQQGLLKAETLTRYLTDFYQKTAKTKVITASAFPGFRDIYSQAGVGTSYGYLNPRDGETFQLTLDLALASNPNLLQLVTWNDYGEGTTIEPAEDYGYRYLEMVQATRRSLNPAFPYQASDLPLPLQLFTLRKAYANDAATLATLTEASQAIFTGDLAAARQIIQSIPENP
jgi:hypothetical protein